MMFWFRALIRGRRVKRPCPSFASSRLTANVDAFYKAGTMPRHLRSEEV